MLKKSFWNQLLIISIFFFRIFISTCLVAFFISQSVLSLVCEEKKEENNFNILKKRPTLSKNGSLHFIIPDEVLHKNSSFKRAEIELGNHFHSSSNCLRCNELYFSHLRPPTLFVEDQIRKSFIKYICQVYKTTFRFASVFDTYYRIPVYSAYKIKKSKKKIKGSGSTTWKYEPRLEGKKGINMGMISEINGLDQNDVMKQATENEYTNSGWDKGHLFPNSYNVSEIF